MEGNKINGLYSIAVAYPSLITVIGTAIYATYENQGYKSEWITEESVILMFVVFSVIYSFIIALLALTIFLTKIEVIQDNSFLRFLSWFLLPLGLIFTMVIHEITTRNWANTDFNYLLILNLPFLVGLIWSYLKFNRIKKSP